MHQKDWTGMEDNVQRITENYFFIVMMDPVEFCNAGPRDADEPDKKKKRYSKAKRKNKRLV